MKDTEALKVLERRLKHLKEILLCREGNELHFIKAETAALKLATTRIKQVTAIKQLILKENQHSNELTILIKRMSDIEISERENDRH